MTPARELAVATHVPGNGPATWALAMTANQQRPRQSSDAVANHAGLARATVEARAALEEVAAAATTAADRARSMAEVLDQALAVLADGVPAADRPRFAPASTSAASTGAALSPREREVLTLLTEGRSNKAIAAALFVSPNTVKTHVASLMSKMQAGSRAHLAAIATRQALA